MLAIYKREINAYFSSILAYIIMAIYLFFSALFFYLFCFERGSNGVINAISNMFTIVVLIIPLITMRSFAEEKRQHTDQALMTAPVSLNSIILGKYLGAFTLYAICNVFYLFYALMLITIVPGTALDWGHLLWAILGSLLIGAALLSTNLFFSSVTEHQIIAAVLGMAVGFVTMLYDTIISLLETYIGSLFNVSYNVVILDKFSFTSYYEDFISGIVSPVGIVFFLSWTAFFLFITNRVLDRKRWA